MFGERCKICLFRGEYLSTSPTGRKLNRDYYRSSAAIESVPFPTALLTHCSGSTFSRYYLCSFFETHINLIEMAKERKSSSAFEKRPEWVKDEDEDSCMACGEEFNILMRRVCVRNRCAHYFWQSIMFVNRKPSDNLSASLCILRFTTTSTTAEHAEKYFASCAQATTSSCLSWDT